MIFKETKNENDDSLLQCRYKTKLNLKQPQVNESKDKHGRKRNIIWFNPSYNRDVTTNVDKIFLQLVGKHFPQSNTLHKIFNRNEVKVCL